MVWRTDYSTTADGTLIAHHYKVPNREPTPTLHTEYVHADPEPSFHRKRVIVPGDIDMQAQIDACRWITFHRHMIGKT